MRAHWKVVDGVLAFDGKGESLCTKGDYADFELLVDWKIEKGGDSGLYLRGSPQVQIWDAEANPAGSGGLFNNKKGPSQPLEKADRPVGEWNTFRILMIGERVTVYLNDRRVVDNTVLENYWEREKPIYPSGQIELQAHGNPLCVPERLHPGDPARRRPSRRRSPTPRSGFVPLFNGRDLEGWTGGGDGYAAEDGKIVVHPERGGGNLYTAKEYADFVLRFEFKLTPAANNGLGIRAPLEGDAAYEGMELQILEDGSPVYWGLAAVPVPRLDLRRRPGPPRRPEADRRVEHRGGHGAGPARHRRRQRDDRRRRRPRRGERRGDRGRPRPSRPEADERSHRLPRPRLDRRVPKHPDQGDPVEAAPAPVFAIAAGLP